MLLALLILIGAIISLVVGICGFHYDGIEGFCSHFFVGLIFTVIISFMISIMISGVVSEGSIAIEPSEMKDTFELNDNGLVKHWSSNGYKYTYITKKGEVREVSGDLVEIKIIEEDTVPYGEKWSYKYSNDTARFWLLNMNAHKFIFYVPEDWVEEYK